MTLAECFLAVLRSAQHPFTFGFHHTVAAVQGLYAFWLNGKCLYVGQSNNLSTRLYQHRMQEHNRKLERYFHAWPYDIRVSYIALDGDSKDRLASERQAIRALRPATQRQIH